MLAIMTIAFLILSALILNNIIISKNKRFSFFEKVNAFFMSTIMLLYYVSLLGSFILLAKFTMALWFMWVLYMFKNIVPMIVKEILAIKKEYFHLIDRTKI